ncbi:MAG: hypothetical protein HOL27_07870 [Candidatus Marinimicrobia bacterium]|jgi:hypothetical protein|nr:hypothetical protein [Candidatus Neomarinimicrobiota bacterium]
MKNTILTSFAFILFCSIGMSATRVVGTRPGLMMRVPMTSTNQSPYLFRAGFGTEFHNFNPMNTAKGVYFDMELKRGFSFGFSSVQGGDTTSLGLLGESLLTPPIEFGFHFQKKVYTYNDISISVGLQDVVFTTDPSSTELLSINTQLLSAFAVLGSEKNLGEYKFNTYMGFGTGGFAPSDTIEVIDSLKATKSGVFLGFLFKTPYLEKWGGLDIVGEFDGTGVNVGLRIPLTSDYRLNLGFTHLDKLPEWAVRYWPGHPGFTVGFDMVVPRKDKASISAQGPSGGLLPGYNSSNDFTVPMHLDSTLSLADLAVSTLRDSMSLMNNEMRNMMIRLASVEQKKLFLNDSLKAITLKQNVAENNMNEAMRHLSKSLRYFYAGDYREALKEVDLALELNPNMALAYARRGSIYYKLGDVQRATINWNLALRLDPEYDDVRNILKALHEDRLKSTSIFEEE